MYDCTCDICIKACSHGTPGWFTPGQMEKAAEYLGLPPSEFMEKYVAIDYYYAHFNIYVPIPATNLVHAGSLTPFYQRDRCCFLNDKNRCLLHPVKPYECAVMNCKEVNNITRSKIAYEWLDYYNQLPEKYQYQSDFSITHIWKIRQETMKEKEKTHE